MDVRVLDSIVELTNKTDADALDFCLLDKISRHIHCRNIGIYFSYFGARKHQIMLRLGRAASQGSVKYCWESYQPVAAPEERLLDCLLKEKFGQQQNADGTTSVWIPLSSEERHVCLYLEMLDFQPEQVVITSAFAKIYSNHIGLISNSEKDKLTGLFSRHAFEGKLKKLLKMQASVQAEIIRQIPKRHAGKEDQAWLVMFDIDNFKRVNDNFGHLCGDEVLLKFSQLLTSFFRSTDLQFRFGGEEFLMLMEPTNKVAVMDKLEAFRVSVEQTEFPKVGHITFSAGVTEALPEVFEATLLDRADKALYYAKENGRNQVHCFEDLAEHGLLIDTTMFAEVDLF